jgi:hypothetical protein
LDTRGQYYPAFRVPGRPRAFVAAVALDLIAVNLEDFVEREELRLIAHFASLRSRFLRNGTSPSHGTRSKVSSSRPQTLQWAEAKT